MGVAGDQQVIASDRLAAPFQGGADVGGVIGRGGIEGQRIEPGGEAFHLLAVMLRAGGCGGAVQEFGQRDGGDGRAPAGGAM